MFVYLKDIGTFINKNYVSSIGISRVFKGFAVYINIDDNVYTIHFKTLQEAENYVLKLLGDVMVLDANVGYYPKSKED